MEEERKPGEDLSKDFASMADELGFELRPEPFAVGDRDDIGFILIAAPRVMEYETSSAPPGVGADDEAEIVRIIEGWESLEPQTFSQTYTNFANENFLLLGSDGICGARGASLKNRQDFKKELEKSKVHCPRQSTVSNVQIVHIGGHRASATYTIDENLTDGTSFHGNAVAILVKLTVGWRIVIATDHLRTDSGS